MKGRCCVCSTVAYILFLNFLVNCFLVVNHIMACITVFNKHLPYCLVFSIKEDKKTLESLFFISFIVLEHCKTKSGHGNTAFSYLKTFA